MNCPSCRMGNSRESKYCRECGTRLAPPTAGATAGGPPPLPGSPRVEQLLEQVLQALDRGDTEEALGLAQAALALDPQSAAAHSALATVYERQGLRAEAVRQLDLALRIDPDRQVERARRDALMAAPASPRPAARWTAGQIALLSVVSLAVAVSGAGLGVLLH